MRSSPQSQRGAAFLTFVALLSAVMILFVLGQASWQSKQRLNQLQDVRASRVTQATEQMRQWYARNAPLIESSDYVLPQGNAFLNEVGIPLQWGLSAAISQQQQRGQIHYRVMAIWVTNDDDEQTPVFDPVTGLLTLCPDSEKYCGGRAAARYEGFEVASEHYATTVRSLRQLATAAQAHFHGLWLADPDHNLSVNYFRGCDAPQSKLPCVDSWTAIDTTTLLEELGESESRSHDAWGNDVEVLNGGAYATGTPLRMGFRATTPWGEPILVYALQRL